MEKKSFYLAMTGQLACLLLAFSPFAPFLGMLVVAGFVGPVLVLFALTGGVEAGRDADLFVSASFLVLGVLCALLALASFYRAAGAAERQEPGMARFAVVTGLTMILAPVVMYLSYRSLGIG